MTTFIFTGPTISAQAARQHLDAVYLPPVSQGDVIRVLGRKPTAIGIIDGFFHNVPAVWHKEILAALHQGVPVYGAASMGALRAAELHAFGMVGVGAVFEAYRDGSIEDDDEVAVTHGPAELGYLALSEAMVNVRCTLADAFGGGVIPDRARALLERVAKDMPYTERTYDRLLKVAAAAGLPARDVEVLRAWLPAGRRDLKREDGVRMLQAMRARQAAGPERFKARFHFEETTLWQSAVRGTLVQTLAETSAPQT